MPKYSYYDIREDIRCDSSYKLPVDINQPVRDFLTKIGCSDAITWVDIMEQRLGWGRIEISKKGMMVRLNLSSEYGMILGWDQFETMDTKNWSFVEYQHVKNKNIERKQKDGQNGR